MDGFKVCRRGIVNGTPGWWWNYRFRIGSLLRFGSVTWQGKACNLRSFAMNFQDQVCEMFLEERRNPLL